MRLLLAVITLTLTLTADGLQFVVWSDTPTTVYIQLDGQSGASVSPTIFQTDLGAGEGFGRTVLIHAPGSIRVRVWDGGEEPSADQTIQLPTYPTYIPLVHGATIN